MCALEIALHFVVYIPGIVFSVFLFIFFLFQHIYRT
jgi:hypothetical protein